VKRSLVAVALLIGFFPAMAQPSDSGRESWHPAAEPADWARIRRQLIRLGPPRGLSERQWVFLRSLDQPDLQAGEYIAVITPGMEGKERTAEFTGVVLLRRGGAQGEWQVRERAMRVLCGPLQLEVRDADGNWQAYDGREDPETRQRRRWICSQASTTD
jgi:hypothetical protein